MIRIHSPSHLTQLAALVAVSSPLIAADWIAAMVLHWQCPFHEATGMYCPACGATRALVALLGGQPMLAIRSNALLFVAPCIVIGLEFLPNCWGGRLGGDLRASVLIAVLVLFTVIRNLPWFWFLRPA
jgi:hypothetical protein